MRPERMTDEERAERMEGLADHRTEMYPSAEFRKLALSGLTTKKVLERMARAAGERNDHWRLKWVTDKAKRSLLDTAELYGQFEDGQASAVSQ